MTQPGIRCPHCGSALTRITDTRQIDQGKRRRRICHHCEGVFHTVETTEPPTDNGRVIPMVTR